MNPNLTRIEAGGSGSPGVFSALFFAAWRLCASSVLRLGSGLRQCRSPDRPVRHAADSPCLRHPLSSPGTDPPRRPARRRCEAGDWLHDEGSFVRSLAALHRPFPGRNGCSKGREAPSDRSTTRAFADLRRSPFNRVVSAPRNRESAPPPSESRIRNRSSAFAAMTMPSFSETFLTRNSRN